MALDRTWYNTLVDDDGSNTVGSLWDKTDVDALMDAVDAAIVTLNATDATKAPLASPTFTGTPAAPTAALGTSTTQLATTAFTAAALAPGVSAPTTTGTATALAIPAGAGNLVLFVNNATLLTVQGIAAGLDGQLLTIFSKGAGQIDFYHAHASGTALGKLNLFATTGFTSLAAGAGVAVFQYDLTLTKWRLVAHEQGDWITPAFVAGDFTASAGNWTVASATTHKYYLNGRKLTHAWAISGTTSGTPVSVKILNPCGFTPSSMNGIYYIGQNGAGVAEAGYYETIGASLALQRFGNVAFGAGTVTVYGCIVCAVS
jgi:hypothetical protein